MDDLKIEIKFCQNLKESLKLSTQMMICFVNNACVCFKHVVLFGQFINNVSRFSIFLFLNF